MDLKKTTYCLDISKRRYLFAKQILKLKYNKDKNSKRDICPRSDSSCRLRGEPRSMQKDADLSEMALKNVEALAGEIDVFLPCMETCSFCWCYYPPTENDPNDLFVEGEFYL